MSLADQLLAEVLHSVCGGRRGCLRAAMLQPCSNPSWGNWWKVYEVRWEYRPGEGYRRQVLDTGFWPTSYDDACRWAERNIAPKPFIPLCPASDTVRRATNCKDDLRYLASVPRVLELCPWLPERLQALEILDEF